MKKFIIDCAKYFIVLITSMMAILITINTVEDVTWPDLLIKIKEKFGKKIIEVKKVESEE